MDKNTHSALDDLHFFQNYIESNFEEFSHESVDSGTLYEFGKQVFYVLGSIIEEMNSK